MSRILVLVLAAANLLYFGWTWTVGRSEPRLTAATAATTSPAAAAPAAPAAPPPCATLGPFLDATLVDGAEQQLRKVDLSPRRRDTTEQVQEGWWVYVANADAATQARSLDLLRRWNMRDSVAMPNDPEFRVSVGIYSQQSRAEERAQLVQRLKLDAIVTERYKAQPAVWFDFPGVARAALADGRLKKSGLPLERLRVEDCPAAEPPAEESPDSDSTADLEGPRETGIAAVMHPQGSAPRGV